MFKYKKVKRDTYTFYLMPPATILLYEEMNKYIQISHLPDRWNLINTVFLN